MTSLATELVRSGAPAAPRLLALRLAARELRGGLRGFGTFVACIALGVMAVAGVGSFSRSLSDGLAREGRAILGGDVAFSLVHREIGPEERAFLEARGLVAVSATMRAMARAKSGAALVELKAVDGAYPLYGTLRLEPAGPPAAVLAEKEGAFGAAAESALLARLGLRVGDRIEVGRMSLEIRAAVDGEPDKLASGLGFGPRLLVSLEALRASGLLQPGSLVRWHYKLQLASGAASDRAVQAVAAEARAAFPHAGWEVRTRANASPRLERDIERFMQFLTLVGLTALLVGGVGVANAVRSHLDRKREAIATLKALGASGATVVRVYLVQALALAVFGTGIGLAAGAALPFLVAKAADAVIPLPIAPSLYPLELAIAAGYGILTALAFALWPLGRAHDIPVAALFRDAVAPEPRWPRRRYILAAALAVATLAALAILFAFDRRIAAVFVVGAAAVLAGLQVIALAIMRAAARSPRARSTIVRLAVANIHRPGALTPAVVLSLGLGLALLVTVALIDGNLRRQFAATLPARAPAFYFLDLQQDEAKRFETFIAARAPQATLERVPMLRGRIVAVKGVPAERLRPSSDAAWVLQSDRGLTYADRLPEGSRVVSGEWWPAGYDGPPLVSLERRIAAGLGVAVGDSVTVNVLGRDMTAQIANLRAVDWQSLGINFVLVFSPNAFRGAPHTTIATLTYPDGGDETRELSLIKALAESFPAVTVVRVREALEAVGKLVENLLVAVRSASLLSVLAAILVLGGALGASHRHRVYEAVILKTLGATRGQLLAAYGLEYLLLGLVTAIFGMLMGSLAAWYVVAEIMNLRFVWLPGAALAAASAAVALTVVFGLSGTLTALSQKAAPVLRHR
ncbi:MAG TPA: FtsX-like permease family protein [Xanthobacteraceae bacterium]|nr:FtsX-like permease family protein [Xanthobacteraceae bacterium]